MRMISSSSHNIVIRRRRELSLPESGPAVVIVLCLTMLRKCRSLGPIFAAVLLQAVAEILLTIVTPLLLLFVPALHLCSALSVCVTETTLLLSNGICYYI